jgi:uncharacterized protein YcgI (DUF1989 family)
LKKRKRCHSLDFGRKNVNRSGARIRLVPFEDRRIVSEDQFEAAKQVVVMEPGAYLTLELSKGEVLRVEDVQGRQCADLAFFGKSSYLENRERAGTGAQIAQSQIEHYSQAVTASRNRHVYLGRGHALYTNACNPVMTIVEDTVGHHDVISAFCNPETNLSRWGEQARGKRTCKENIQDALAPLGIRVDLPCTFNIFMDFGITPEGRIEWGETLSRSGDFVDLRAEMDVIAAISNCPMELNAANGFSTTQLRVAVFEEETYRRVAPDSLTEAIAVPSEH